MIIIYVLLVHIVQLICIFNFPGGLAACRLTQPNPKPVVHEQTRQAETALCEDSVDYHTQSLCLFVTGPCLGVPCPACLFCRLFDLD